MLFLKFIFLVTVNFSSATDAQDADALGYANDYIEIYSNSWDSQ